MQVSQYNFSKKQNVTNIEFNGCMSYEKIFNNNLKKSQLDIFIHESYFFRDIKTLKFIKEYISGIDKKNFNIVSAGCSEGFELLSLKMILEDSIKEKNFNFLGFDPGSEAIKNANTYLYTVHKPENDFIKYHEKDIFLAFPTVLDILNPLKFKLYNLFHHNFILDNVKDVFIKDMGLVNTMFYKLKEQNRDNINFKLGNILDLDEIVSNNSVDVLSFKNALYHLTFNKKHELLEEQDLKLNLTKLVEQVTRALTPNGIFVLDTLRSTHNPNITTILYKNFHDNHFVPIYKEDSYPVVWKKIDK